MTSTEPVSDNYISDVAYSSRYNQYLNPLNLHYIAQYAGLCEGNLASDFRFCDLGCGDGTTLNIIASMYPDASFYGVDFNEEHIITARKRAADAGLKNIEYHHLDFARMDAVDLLPLDFITCFGTFSWINRSLQDAILRFAGESLVDNGVFVVHYAAKPGKAQIDPLWHLLRTATCDMEDASTERARAGVETIGLLKNMGARFFNENPVALSRSNALPGQDLNYLAHEALSEWQAFYHSEIAERARARGLRFAGLLSPDDNDPDFTIPEAFRPVLDGYADPVVRTTLEDYILNRGLRNDVYVKTEAPARPGASRISRQPVLLISPGGDIAPTVKTAIGKEISFQTPVYQAMAAELRQRICSASELHHMPSLSGHSEEEIATTIVKLVASGQAVPVKGALLNKPVACVARRCKPALRITGVMLGTQIPIAGFTNLPSPLTGQCAPVDQLIALSLSALLYQPDGEEQNWVAEQIRQSGVAGIQGVAKNILPEQVDSIAGQALQMTVNSVLPALVTLGVYRQAGGE